MRIRPPSQYPQKRLLVFAGIHTSDCYALQRSQVDAVMASFSDINKQPATEKMFAVLDTWPQYRYLDSGVFTFIRESMRHQMATDGSQQKYRREYMLVVNACRYVATTTISSLTHDTGLSTQRVREFCRRLEAAGRIQSVDTDTYRWTCASEDWDLHITPLTKHIESYIAYVKGPGREWDFVFDIDVDNLRIANEQGKSISGEGVANYCREQLTRAVGGRLIPIWHHNVDEYPYPKFTKLLDNYPYVGVGSDISHTHQDLRYLCSRAHQAKVLVHGLGTTKANVLLTTPYDSVDSSTWLSARKFGRVGSARLTTMGMQNHREVGTMRAMLEWAKVRGFDTDVLLAPIEGREPRLEVAIKYFQERQDVANQITHSPTTRVSILP